MPLEIRMPTLSSDVTHADVVDWLVAVGDTVQAGDVVAELETDKSTVELEAPAAGVVSEIRVPGGTTEVEAGTVLAVLDAAPSAAARPEAPADEAGSGASQSAEQRDSPPPPPQADRAEQTASADADAAPTTDASPLAARLAEQAGLDLAAIAGSGARGRVVKADVEAALAGEPGSGPEPAPAPEKQNAGPGARRSQPGPRLAVHDEGETPYVEIAPSRMRRVIAERLAEAKRTIPHFYLRIECRLDALLDVRRRLNEAESDTRLSVNDFIVRAAALALREVPEANVAWADGTLRRFERVDVSVAVATDGGLVTPIVRGADRKGLAAISAEMRDLAERARARKLAPAEYQGGSFSVSNLGMYGIEAVYPIVNPGQSCILGVGAGEARAVVTDGEIGVATVMTCTLSADHRAVDGAVGARLLSSFQRRIEDPLSMVL